ncbi:MAG: hypothetical protein J6K74_05535 [Marinifilaceae bacterium]|nr:hypothetical protein [Marinifilaceae bacterium]
MSENFDNNNNNNNFAKIACVMLKYLYRILFALSLFVGVLLLIVDYLDKQELRKCVIGCIGRQLNLSDSLVFLNSSDISDISDFDYKIFCYIPPGECLGCKLNMTKWNDFMNEFPVNNVTLVFLTHLENKNEVNRYANLLCFRYPIIAYNDNKIYDNITSIMKIANGINVFLLNKNNLVESIGNPLYNKKIKDLYIDIIKN